MSGRGGFALFATSLEFFVGEPIVVELEHGRILVAVEEKRQLSLLRRGRSVETHLLMPRPPSALSS